MWTCRRWEGGGGHRITRSSSLDRGKCLLLVEKLGTLDHQDGRMCGGVVHMSRHVSMCVWRTRNGLQGRMGGYATVAATLNRGYLS